MCIVDQSIGASPEAVSAALRGAGFNAGSVAEAFGKNGIKDSAIKELADDGCNQFAASNGWYDSDEESVKGTTEMLPPSKR